MCAAQSASRVAERQTSYLEEAVARPDTEFSVEELASAEAQGFERILSQLDAQRAVQRNDDTPQVPGVSVDSTPELYLSDAGFSALFGVPPSIQYTVEGQGARSRPTGMLASQVILGSFGYAIDVAVLRTGARSIQVDAGTGHNPFKVYQRLQQVLFQPRQSVSHLITRRGDIFCCCPWNRAPASPSRIVPNATDNAIVVELESLHTADTVAYKGTPEADFKVLGLEPYTPEQRAALAFILKKLGLWTQTDPTTPLGFTLGDVRQKIGQTPGILPLSALNPDTDNSPGGEFFLPIGWRYGDALPPWIDTPAWAQRLALRYSAYSDAPVSHYEQVQALYTSVTPAYSIETELFRPVSQTVFTAHPPRRRGAAGVSEAAVNAQGEGFARSVQMQSSLRSGFYRAGPVANAAMANATEAHILRIERDADTPARVPRVINALGFNFETGQWDALTTVIDKGELPPIQEPEEEP